MDNNILIWKKKEILQMEEEKKVCIIDNFEEIVVSDKLMKKNTTLSYLQIWDCGYYK